MQEFLLYAEKFFLRLSENDRIRQAGYAIIESAKDGTAYADYLS